MDLKFKVSEAMSSYISVFIHERRPDSYEMLINWYGSETGVASARRFWKTYQYALEVADMIRGQVYQAFNIEL